ncbi:hypothetical protein BKA64DRAFT_690659 [Cadophora sp. MPI-SDFR-AT-0126]|nr:hypothetical protein BKA64DRAFT_690659 [Leotiomycetes sp. MPI-SDFR-AT-0126]
MAFLMKSLAKSTNFLDPYPPLGDSAFSTAETSGQTLKGILEPDTIPRVFFDVRNNSDALFSHYEDALIVFSKYIERNITLLVSERKAWMETKAKGLNLFAPERGGNYEVFNVRPLHEHLWRRYHSKFSVAWAAKIAAFNGTGRHTALEPPGGK